MSVTTSPPATTDPLAATASPSAFADPLADEAPFSSSSREDPRAPEPSRDAEPARQGSLTRDRAALLAPNVEGQLGADAIDLVRAQGLIAAIETVKIADHSQQGVVIEQDPPAGTQMLREGVLTLQVAQAPAEPQGADNDAVTAHGEAEWGHAASDGYPDDTEQWFATLGPTLDNPALQTAAARPPRRRRKHRPAPVPGVDANARFEVPPDPLPPPRDPQLENHWDPSLQPTAPHPRPDWQEPVSPQPRASYTLSDRRGSPARQPTARYPLANAREPVSPQHTIGDPLPDGNGDPSPQSETSDPPPQEHWDLSQQPTVRPSLPDWQEPVSPQPTIGDQLPDGHRDPSPEPAAPGYFTSLIAAVLVRLPGGSITPTWRRRALICAAAIVGLLLFTLAAGPHSHHAVLASVARAPTSHAQVMRLPASRRTRKRLATASASLLPAIRPRRAEARRTSHELVVAIAGATDPVPTSAPPSPPSEPTPGPFIYLGK